MEPLRYTTVARALHWAIALVVAAQFTLGWWMQSIPKSPQGPRADAFNLHKSIGLSILVLMALRILWRSRHAPPPWPTMPAWQRRLAWGNHAFLYGLLVLLPATGYLGSVFSGYPVKFFGLVLPRWGSAWPAAKDFMSGTHLACTWLLAAAVVLHLAGAAHNAAVGRGGVLGRMGPRGA
ncbi:MAG TPA: cytochrome b [Usitatibacter sp.]|nr:cytochrome b [Usitatibacter sp.]